MPVPRDGWRKSSYSNNGGASCVEVKFTGDSVLIRDSKYLRNHSNDPDRQPIIVLSTTDWAAFLDLAAGLTSVAVPGIRSVDRHDHAGATITATTGVQLHYTHAEWAAFTAGIHAGEVVAA